MGFKSMLFHEFATTHENRFFKKLVDLLSTNFGEDSDENYLIGNIILNGNEIDAIFIKKNALIVLDFKDYSGNLEISENSAWTIDGVEINKNRKNPYAQLSQYKYGLLDLLKRKLEPNHDNWIQLGHINTIVLFHEKINFNTSDIKTKISPSASKWFNICDIETICQSLREIVSSKTNITNRFELILNAFGITKFKEYQNNSNEKPISSINNETSREINSETFSEQYYRTARELNSIELLIVGQDPYETNANGVAFCKDASYQFVQENCCGMRVMTSIGIDKTTIKTEYKNPKVLFLDLLISKGICFLNINNFLFKTLRENEIESSILETKSFNDPIVKKSKKILLLGKSKTKYYFEKFYNEFEYTEVLIHPSERSKQNNEDEWKSIWETKYIQNKYLI